MQIKNKNIISMILVIMLASVPLLMADASERSYDQRNNADAVMSAGTLGISFLTLSPGINETELNFSWHTSSSSANPVVLIWDDGVWQDEFTGTCSTEVSSLSGMYYNRVTVTGLEPETSYTYQLGDGNGNWSEEYTTKTGDPSSFSYMVFGDPQTASQANGDMWKNVLEHALAVCPELAFIASTGDNIDSNTLAQYGYFFTPEEILSGLPLAVCMGNHEGSGSAPYAFYNPPDPDVYQNYWYRYGDTLFIVWNCTTGSTASMEAFLQSAVDANPDATWRILNFHYNVYGQAGHSQTDSKTYRDAGYVAVIDKFDIDVVFNGHDHSYTRTYPMTYSGSAATSNTEGIQAEIPGPGGSVIIPVGTVYFTLNSASDLKFYALEAIQPYTAVMDQKNLPNFSIVTMTSSTFTCTTYEVKADNTIAMIDTYTIMKIDGIEHYTVTFDTDGGTAVSPAKVPADGTWKINKPSDPFRQGFSLKHWLLEGAEFDFDTPITGDITLTAVWEAVDPNVGTAAELIKAINAKVPVITLTNDIGLNGSGTLVINSDVTIQSEEGEHYTLTFEGTTAFQISGGAKLTLLNMDIVQKNSAVLLFTLLNSSELYIGGCNITAEATATSYITQSDGPGNNIYVVDSVIISPSRAFYSGTVGMKVWVVDSNVVGGAFSFYRVTAILQGSTTYTGALGAEYVVFDLRGTSVEGPSSATNLVDLTKAGTLAGNPNYKIYYSFDPNGFKTGEVTEYTGPIEITEDVTIYASLGFMSGGVTYYTMPFAIECEYDGSVPIHTVTFDTDGGTTFVSIKVHDGDKVAKPGNPIKVGSIFKGWLLEGVPYDFDAPVSGNITLTADWSGTPYVSTAAEFIAVLEAKAPVITLMDDIDLNGSGTLVINSDVIIQSEEGEHYTLTFEGTTAFQISGGAKLTLLNMDIVQKNSAVLLFTLLNSSELYIGGCNITAEATATSYITQSDGPGNNVYVVDSVIISPSRAFYSGSVGMKVWVVDSNVVGGAYSFYRVTAILQGSTTYTGALGAEYIVVDLRGTSVEGPSAVTDPVDLSKAGTLAGNPNYKIYYSFDPNGFKTGAVTEYTGPIEIFDDVTIYASLGLTVSGVTYYTMPFVIECELPSYTVTFKDWNDTELKTESVRKGDAASAPSDPSRLGYDLTGWDEDFSYITGDTTVTAQYTIKTSFDAGFRFDVGLLRYEVTSPGTLLQPGEVKVLGFVTNPMSPTDLTIPNMISLSYVTFTVTAIDSSAFSMVMNLRSVVLPNTVTSIGNMAFMNCFNMTDINLGSVRTIGNMAFMNTAITKADLSSAVSIDMMAFMSCTELETVHLGPITNIGTSVFNTCLSLKTINLGSVTNIGASAFSGCTALQTIDLSSAVSLGNNAFSSCSGLKTVNFGTSLGTIPNSAFQGCESMTSLDLRGTSVTAIEQDAFWGCGIATLELGPVTNIGMNAFRNCPLPIVAVGPGVTYNSSFPSSTVVVHYDLAVTYVSASMVSGKAYVTATVPVGTINYDLCAGTDTDDTYFGTARNVTMLVFDVTSGTDVYIAVIGLHALAMPISAYGYFTYTENGSSPAMAGDIIHVAPDSVVKITAYASEGFEIVWDAVFAPMVQYGILTIDDVTAYTAIEGEFAVKMFITSNAGGSFTYSVDGSAAKAVPSDGKINAPLGSEVTVTAVPSAGYGFAWSSGAGNTKTVGAEPGLTLSGTFSVLKYNITLPSGNGSFEYRIDSDAGWTAIGAGGTISVPHGSGLQLKALPNSGYTFEWDAAHTKNADGSMTISSVTSAGSVAGMFSETVADEDNNNVIIYAAVAAVAIGLIAGVYFIFVRRP